MIIISYPKWKKNEIYPPLRMHSWKITEKLTRKQLAAFYVIHHAYGNKVS